MIYQAPQSLEELVTFLMMYLGGFVSPVLCPGDPIVPRFNETQKNPEVCSSVFAVGLWPMTYPRYMCVAHAILMPIPVTSGA